ncbi:uncharacterized protein [Lepeophtheirus salmonis]|uniref:uncharacterized protein n=1 Tax=Lepeophtheirus salmonis TaxID=72036 RepID=UPI001AE60FD9|nr:transcription cofactor vestigial-like protein 3 [Lepeophtheirus salmonis]
MSCATAPVMYQPYSPYNNSSPSATMPPQGFHSSPDRVPPSQQSGIVEDNNNRSHLENKHHVQQVFKVEHLHSTPPQDLSSYQPNNVSNTSSCNNSQSSPPTSRPPSHLNQHDEDSSDSTISAHRLSSNIVVFTHYVGNASSVVEDHFSRALSSYERDETSYKPMSARNLPASFWTAPSDYTPPSPRHSASATACNLLNQSSTVPYGDIYPESITGALHQLAADWQYPHASVGHTPSSSSYSSNYSNYAARFQSANYWSPRLVGSSSTTSSVKSEWSPEPPYSDFSSHPHHLSHHPYHHYSNIAAVAAVGLESNPSSDASLVNKPHHTAPGPATSAGTDLFWTTTF